MALKAYINSLDLAPDHSVLDVSSLHGESRCVNACAIQPLWAVLRDQRFKAGTRNQVANQSLCSPPLLNSDSNSLAATASPSRARSASSRKTRALPRALDEKRPKNLVNNT